MTKLLTREHSREYSLFRVYAWHTILSKHIPKLLNKNLDEVALVYRGKDLVDVYYTRDFYAELAGLVAMFAKDVEKTKAVINDFYKKFERLLPYFKLET